MWGTYDARETATYQRRLGQVIPRVNKARTLKNLLVGNEVEVEGGESSETILS